jgi:hypothetical protein
MLAFMSATVFAEDKRIYVELPPMMQEHMLSNMRDHLLALQTITQQLANGKYDEAADTAERRLGMSSLESHGASHMGKFMPREMGQIGTSMHRAASRFALAARDAAVEGGLEKAFGALSEVMAQCVACHNGYKIHE